jgi:hypothetical protein
MRAAGMTSLSCHKSLQALAKIVAFYFLRRTGEKIVARDTVFDFVHARDLKHDLAVRRFTNWNSSNEDPGSASNVLAVRPERARSIGRCLGVKID